MKTKKTTIIRKVPETASRGCFVGQIGRLLPDEGNMDTIRAILVTDAKAKSDAKAKAKATVDCLDRELEEAR